MPATSCAPRDGRYELRVTNELEEALFVDRLELIAVDHPAAVEVHPREGLVAPPFPPFELYAARRTSGRPRARSMTPDATSLDALRDLDRRFVDDLPLERIRGYAKPHTLTIDLGAGAGRLRDARTSAAAHRLDRLRVLERQRRRAPGRPACSSRRRCR